jgi:hypothetical protein
MAATTRPNPLYMAILPVRGVDLHVAAGAIDHPFEPQASVPSYPF